MKTRQTTHMTFERAEEVRRVFGLREFPKKTPYDFTGVGLDLPDYMTEREIRQIAACAAMPLMKDNGWYVGDIINWLDAHPDAPMSRADVLAKFQRLGRFNDRTVYNYTSVCRAFPLKQRRTALTFRHHDEMRAQWIKPHVREDLFNRAEREGWGPEDLRREREVYRRKLQGGGHEAAVREELLSMVDNIRSKFPNARAVAGKERAFATELSSLTRLIDRYRKRLVTQQGDGR